MKLNELKDGDLLFVSDCSEMAGAIRKSTGKFSHVGIYFDGKIYHASKRHGKVLKQDLKEFLGEEKYSVSVYRYPQMDSVLVEKRAEALLEKPYNLTFYPNSEGLYCSEFIAAILPIFKTVPMKFGDGKNDVSDFWKNYYKDLGVKVPLDMPGTNPSLLAQSDELEFVGELEIEG